MRSGSGEAAEDIPCWSRAAPGVQLPPSQGEHRGSLGRSACAHWLADPAGSVLVPVPVPVPGLRLLSLNTRLSPWTGLAPRCRGKAFLLRVCCCPKLELGAHVSGLEWPGRGNGYCPLVLAMSLPGLLEFPLQLDTAAEQTPVCRVPGCFLQWCCEPGSRNAGVPQGARLHTLPCLPDLSCPAKQWRSAGAARWLVMERDTQAVVFPCCFLNSNPHWRVWLEWKTGLFFCFWLKMP